MDLKAVFVLLPSWLFCFPLRNDRGLFNRFEVCTLGARGRLAPQGERVVSARHTIS